MVVIEGFSVGGVGPTDLIIVELLLVRVLGNSRLVVLFVVKLFMELLCCLG